MALRPAIQTQPGELNQTYYLASILLAEMPKRDMKAVLFTNNFWHWSGGMSQSIWLTGDEVFDPEYPEDWNVLLQNSARFLSYAKRHRILPTGK